MPIKVPKEAVQTTRLSSATVEAQLNKLPERFGVIKRGKDFLLRCPDHKDGRENTPSMKVNANPSAKFAIGSAHCFACGAHYKSWHKFVTRILGAEHATHYAQDDDPVFDDIIGDLRSDLMEDGQDKLQSLIKNAIAWGDEEWRGIPAHTMRALGAVFTMNLELKHADVQAFLPAYVQGDLVGGVFANLEKKGRNNYFNSDFTDWVGTTLFPFDTVAYMLKKKKLSHVVLVEGPRDALRFISYGIPALAILGTGHAGNEEKYSSLASLPIKHVVLAFDSDDAGRAAKRKAKELLKGEYKVLSFSFREGEDPGNCPKGHIKALIRACYKLK